MVKIMPFDHPTLKYTGMVKPDNRAKYAVKDVVELARCLRPSIDLDMLEHEWLAYAVDDGEDGVQAKPEVFWSEAEHSYPLLASLMHLLMALPHSNAASERVFSMLRKIHTEGRASLCNGTIRSIMSVKLNETGCCHQMEFEPTLKRSMKRAASNYNMSYSSGAGAAATEIATITID